MKTFQNILSWVAWPALVLFFIGVAYWAFGLGYNNELVFLVLGVTNLLVMILLEQLLPLRKDWNLLADRAAFNDIGHTLMAGVVGANIGTFLRTLLFGGLAVLLADLAGGGLWPVHWPLWLQMGLAILLVDFVFYWQHRMFHNVPLLWRLHALHHNPERMHVLKSARLHAGEIVLRFVLIFAPLALLGAPREVLLWYAVLDNTLGNLAHINMRLKFPAFFHRIFVTPGVHHLHHAKDMRLGNGNFGGMLAIWDQLFGTFFHPDEHPDYETGIPDNPIPGNFLKELASPVLWNRYVDAAPATTGQPGIESGRL